MATSKPFLLSSGDKLLIVKTIGAIALTVRRLQPSQWIVATNGSASPSSVEQPASVGWGFVVDRIGCLAGVEVEWWGEALVDDRDPRALWADSLTDNFGELWALAEAFFGCATSLATINFGYFGLWFWSG